MRDASHPGRVVAIVQARMGSSRLPMKSLLHLRAAPLADWVTGRLKRARHLDHVIVATPDTPLDAVLRAHLEENGVDCMAGPEDDVLARFREAALRTHADTVVRVCADNPLIWWEAVDRLIRFHARERCDYSWNHIPRGNLWPDGLGAEILSADLLLEMDRLAETPAQREHCLNYIWDNAERFVMRTFDPEEPELRRPDLKLDVDTAEDFVRLATAPLHPDMDAAEIIRAMDAACEAGRHV